MTTRLMSGDPLDAARAFPRIGSFANHFSRDRASQEKLTADQLEDLKRLEADMALGKIEMERTRCVCPADPATATTLLSLYDRHGLKIPHVVCTNCGLVRCDPYFSETSVATFYESDFYRKLTDPDVYRNPAANFESYAAVGEDRYRRVVEARQGRPITSVVEIGCGLGGNLVPYKARGISHLGLEPGIRFVEFGKQQGLNLETWKIEDISKLDRKFDVIILSHVLEHAIDPKCMMETIHRLVRPGTTFYVEVPDLRSLCIGALQVSHKYLFAAQHLRYMAAQTGWRELLSKPIGPFFYAVFEPGDSAVPEPHIYDEVATLARNYVWREKMKNTLRRVGLFDIVQKAAHATRHRADR